MRTHYLFGFPFLTLNIHGTQIDCLLDTGFNGDLLLPQSFFKRSKNQAIGSADYFLANGKKSSCPIFSIQIDWFGREKKVCAASIDTDLALVGMNMLYERSMILKPSKNVLKIR